MASLKSTISGSPTIYSTATITEKSRSGGTTVLNISISTNLRYKESSLGTGYILKGTVTANGSTKTITLKERSASWSGDGSHKTGTVTFSISVPASTNSITIKYQAKQSGLESVNGGTASGTLSLSKQASSISSTSAGTTLSGPTINLNKVSGLTDNIVLKYGSYSITRNSFNGGKLTFSDAERKTIFTANGGAGITRSWSISGTSKSGSTTTGTYSGSVNITTEAAGVIKSIPNTNVGDPVTVSLDHAYLKSSTGDYCRISVFLDSERTNQLATTTTTGATATLSFDSSAISSLYSSNTTSKTGTIYYKIQSYVGPSGSASEITGSAKNYTGTYSFKESECAPIINSLQAKINDSITPVIKPNITTSYVTFGTNDMDTFISNVITDISLLKYKISSSPRNSADISSQQLEITNQPILTFVDNETSQTKVFDNTNINLIATVYDTRGFSSSVSYSINPVKYTNPQITSLDVRRKPKSDIVPENDTKLVTDFIISVPQFINQWTGTGDYVNIKRMSIFYRYRVFGEVTWSSWKQVLFEDSEVEYSGNTIKSLVSIEVDVNTSFATNSQYEVQFIVRDAVYYLCGETTLGEKISEVIIIPTSEPLVSKRPRKVGINKSPNVESGLDVDGDVEATGYVKAGEYLSVGTSTSVGTYIEFTKSNRDDPEESSSDTIKLGNGKAQIRARRSMIGGHEKAPNYYEDIITFRNGRIIDNENEVAMLETISGDPDETILPEESEEVWDNLLTHYSDNDMARSIFYNYDDLLFDKDVNGKVKMNKTEPITATVPVSNVAYYDSAPDNCVVEIRPIDLSTTQLNNNGTVTNYRITDDSKFAVVKFSDGRYSNIHLKDLNKTYLVMKFVMGDSSCTGEITTNNSWNLDGVMVLYDSEYLRYLTELPKRRWSVINSLYSWSSTSLNWDAFNNHDFDLSNHDIHRLLLADGYSIFEHDKKDYIDDQQTGEHSNSSPKMVLDNMNDRVNNYFNDNKACRFGTNVINYEILKKCVDTLFDDSGSKRSLSFDNNQCQIVTDTVNEASLIKTLPSEYQQVEYIEGTGTQYIDTGYHPNKNTGVDATFKFNEVSTRQQRVFGTQGDNTDLSTLTFDFYINGAGQWGYASKDGTGQWSTTNITSDTLKHTVYFNVKNSGKYLISNTSVIDENNMSNLPTLNSTNQNLYLLATRLFDGTITNYANAKLYSLNIWDGTTLARQFIPCYRKSDDEIGLYDLVGEEFYTNQGTGTFNKGSDINNTIIYNSNTKSLEAAVGATVTPRLPSEYQEVDYIESSGTQYINTGYNPNGKSGFEVDATFRTSGGNLFGSYNTSWAEGYGFFHHSADGSYDYRHYYDNFLTTHAGANNKTNHIEIYSGNVSIDGTSVATSSEKTFTVNYPVVIFAANKAGTIDSYLMARLHRFKIYDDSVLVHDYIPCYRKSDNVIGLYDMKTEDFLTNSGTGSFIKGPDVTNPGKDSIKNLLSGFNDYDEITGVSKPLYTVYNYCSREYANYNSANMFVWDIIYNNRYTPYSDSIIVNVSVNNATFDHGSALPQLSYSVDRPQFIEGKANYRIEDENGIEVPFDSSLPAGTYSIEISSGISGKTQDVVINYSAGVLVVTNNNEQSSTLTQDLVRLNDYIKTELGWGRYEYRFLLNEIKSNVYNLTFAQLNQNPVNITSYLDMWNTIKGLFLDASSEVKNRNFTTNFLDGVTPNSVADALRGRMLTLVNAVMEETYEITTSSGYSFVRYDSSSGTNPVGSPVNAPLKMIDDSDHDYIPDGEQVAFSDIAVQSASNGSYGGSDEYDALDIILSNVGSLSDYDGTYLIQVSADGSISITEESASSPSPQDVESMFEYAYISKYDFGSNQSSTVSSLMEIDSSQMIDRFFQTQYDVCYTFRFHNYDFDIDQFYDVTESGGVTNISLKDEYVGTERTLVAWCGGYISAVFSIMNQDITIKFVNMGNVINIARYKLVGNTGIYTEDVLSEITLNVDPSVTVYANSTPYSYTAFPVFVDETMPFTSRISFYANEQELTSTSGTPEPTQGSGVTTK